MALRKAREQTKQAVLQQQMMNQGFESDAAAGLEQARKDTAEALAQAHAQERQASAARQELRC